MNHTDMLKIKDKVAHTVCATSRDALRFLPLIVEVVTAFVAFAVTLAIVDDESVGLGNGQVFRLATVFALCLFSFSTMFRTYHGTEILDKRLFLNIAGSHALSFCMFVPLWRLMTEGYNVPFLPVITSILICFGVSMGVRFLMLPTAPKEAI